MNYIGELQQLGFWVNTPELIEPKCGCYAPPGKV